MAPHHRPGNAAGVANDGSEAPKTALTSTTEVREGALRPRRDVEFPAILLHVLFTNLSREFVHCSGHFTVRFTVTPSTHRMGP